MIQQFHLWIFFLKKAKMQIWNGIRVPVFTAALFTRAKIIKGTKCPLIEGQMKINCIIWNVIVNTITIVYTIV